ncbi:alpha/beta fold hydrolase [Actinokineospora spheciospongiae]|uniref:alpha/beta fold hydrolase n=1 Tax=Actinokineospora spheciospongiae TaxID=909613 RepID=UPI00054DF4C7|nr:alpha/beta fold hydrolase [Actinokineospora spheciospongiae]
MRTTGRFVLGDGAELALTRAGDPEAGVTVVLAHSFALDRRVWHRLVDALPEAAERPVSVLAYDHRGHGESSAATLTTALVERLADDLVELVDGLVPRGRLVLVGHGAGGQVLTSATARHRDLLADRLAGMAFLSTGVGWLAETSVAWPGSLGAVLRDLRAILGERIGSRLDKATTVGLRWVLLGENPDPDDVRLVADMVTAHWPDTAALFRPGLDRFGREAALEVAADVPVLAMVGDRDRLVPAAHAEALAGAARDGVAVVLPSVGHMLPLEAVAQLLPRLVGLAQAALRR